MFVYSTAGYDLAGFDDSWNVSQFFRTEEKDHQSNDDDDDDGIPQFDGAGDDSSKYNLKSWGLLKRPLNHASYFKIDVPRFDIHCMHTCPGVKIAFTVILFKWVTIIKMKDIINYEKGTMKNLHDEWMHIINFLIFNCICWNEVENCCLVFSSERTKKIMKIDYCGVCYFCYTCVVSWSLKIIPCYF